MFANANKQQRWEGLLPLHFLSLLLPCENVKMWKCECERCVSKKGVQFSPFFPLFLCYFVPLWHAGWMATTREKKETQKKIGPWVRWKQKRKKNKALEYSEEKKHMHWHLSIDRVSRTRWVVSMLKIWFVLLWVTLGWTHWHIPVSIWKGPMSILHFCRQTSEASNTSNKRRKRHRSCKWHETRSAGW